MFRDYRRIEGYEDYIISNYGEVWSLKRGKVILFKQQVGSNGYMLCRLYMNGRGKTLGVHMLVGNHFIGKREGNMSFDHIDRNKLNNRADNIRLATKTEQNINQKIRCTNKTGERNIRIHKDRRPDRNGNEYYLISIKRNKKRLFLKSLNKKKFSLEDAIKVRDDFLLTLSTNC
jgi:hypothetical protein